MTYPSVSTTNSVSYNTGGSGGGGGGYVPPVNPLSTFYGVNGHFTWNWSPNATPYQPAHWADSISRMVDLGMRYYRNGYSLQYNSKNKVTSSDGANFTNFILNYAAPAGIQVAPVYLPATNLATNEATAYTIAFQGGQDMASNLKGLVPWYEVGNELDSACILNGSVRGNSNSDYNNANYQIMRGAVRGCIDGIKSVDTITPIMAPGGAWLHTAFFDMLLAGTQPDGTTGHPTVTWDLTSWHWYTNNYPPNDDIENPTDQGSFNVLAHLAGWGKPIYITECGAVWSAYSQNESAVAAAITGNYLMQRFYNVRNTYNIQHVSLYQLYDAASPGVPGTDNEMNFGLIANDGTTTKTRYSSVKSFIQTNPLP